MAISLEKGKKVSLKKGSQSGLGEILINLNWNTKPAKKGLFGVFGGGQGIDVPVDGPLGDLKRRRQLRSGGPAPVQEVVENFE